VVVDGEAVTVTADTLPAAPVEVTTLVETGAVLVWTACEPLIVVVPPRVVVMVFVTVLYTVRALKYWVETVVCTA
jgi:hypothetical protein